MTIRSMHGLLLVTAFIEGAALMSLEMAGFRLIQPEFGSDIVVWGSLISVFLGGLALGAVLGGRLADRRPSLGMLGAIVLAGGAVTLLLPLVSDAVLASMFPGEGAPLPVEWGTGDAAGGLAVYQPPDLRWPTLGAGTILFGLPALLMGMVSPFAARLFVHALGRLGTGVGKVYGVSTVGSILGTLGTAFYLTAWMGTTGLIVANGVLLVALGLALVAVAAVTKAPEAAT
jgi:MFS family permease